MPITEHTINDAIAVALRQTRHVWRGSEIVKSENLGMLKGSAGRPDILVLEPNVSPVVIETELLPAVTVAADATNRLGKTIKSNGRKILSAIAVRLPVVLASQSGEALNAAISATAALEMAVFTGDNPSAFQRWPTSGWIKGGVVELSALVQSASIPPEVIARAADQLVEGINEAAGLMAEMATTNPGAIQQISAELKQENGEQTHRMAATILTNAFVFHGSLAGRPGELAGVKSVEQICGEHCGVITVSGILKEWAKILAINYWPIFDIARRLLEVIPQSHAKAFIEVLSTTAGKLLENRLMQSHDLTGAVFQALIADRKFLAAYYTQPASAALLVGLTVQSNCIPVGETEVAEIGDFRIADFACGTGTLLSAAYHRISQLHEIAGGDAEAIHPQMMATALVGFDVLPAAAHLTASMLSGTHPTIRYDGSSIFTLEYGNHHGHFRIGSLALLDQHQAKIGIVPVSARELSGTGAKENKDWWRFRFRSFNVVVMNPPFTRSTGHEGEKIGVPNPMFAAFGITDKDQREMAKLAQGLAKGTAAHGNAGEASYFLVLADRMLVPGGLLGLVMPLSLLLGDAWEKSRALLAKHYRGLILVSIAGLGDEDSSFSADTGMAECLVIGQNTRPEHKRATFVVLRARPQSSMVGSQIAQQITHAIAGGKLRKVEDGPFGGTPLYFGDDLVGYAIDAPLPPSGSWNLARIADLSLGQAAYQLDRNGLAWLPRMDAANAPRLPITQLGKIAAKMGPYHADINGKDAKGGVRGPFDISPIRAGSAPAYTALWSHDAKEQRSMSFDADSEATPKSSEDESECRLITEKVARVWSYASNCHFNRDFRFNSQSTGRFR